MNPYHELVVVEAVSQVEMSYEVHRVLFGFPHGMETQMGQIMFFSSSLWFWLQCSIKSFESKLAIWQ